MKNTPGHPDQESPRATSESFPFNKDSEVNFLPGEIILTTDMGGEVEKLIMETSMKRYECLGLPTGHFELVGAWHGYPHDGGIPDKDGKNWWAYQKCTHSNYEMSYWKVKNRIEKIQEVPA